MNILIGSGLFFSCVAISYARIFAQLGHDVKLIGPTPDRVRFPQDFELPHSDKSLYQVNQIIEALATVDWEPDLYVQVDDLFRVQGVLNSYYPFRTIPAVFLGLYNHRYNYNHPLFRWFDFRMLASRYTLRPGDYWLPLAFDPLVLKREQDDADVWLFSDSEAHTKAVEERFSTNLLGGKVAFEHSNMLEITKFTFAAMGQGVPLVINRRPWLDQIGEEGLDFLAYAEDAMPLIQELLNDRVKAEVIGSNASNCVAKNHTYLHRAQELLDTVFGGAEALRRY